MSATGKKCQQNVIRLTAAGSLLTTIGPDPNSYDRTSRGPDLASTAGRCDGVDLAALFLRQRGQQSSLHMLFDLLGGTGAGNDRRDRGMIDDEAQGEL